MSVANHMLREILSYCLFLIPYTLISRYFPFHGYLNQYSPSKRQRPNTRDSIWHNLGDLDRNFPSTELNRLSGRKPACRRPV